MLFLSKNSQKVSAAATGFSAGHIIDNNIFTNGGALSVQQIQTFLNDMVGTCFAPGAKSTSPENGSCINQYVENTSTLQNNFGNPGASIPGGISAAQIIYNAATQYSINSEVLLATMQKEQGLVTDNWPYYSEYQAAMGYECPDSTPSCNGGAADFYKQVDGAAWQFRDYLNNPGAFNYWLGPNTIAYAPGCAGTTVNIQNAATAALYIYTPYQPDSNVLNYTNPIGSSSGPGPAINDSCAAYGNRNFWWYFNTWFGPSVDTSVYLGEETGTSTIYVFYDGEKQGIPSIDVLDAWGLNGLPVTQLDPSLFNTIPTASTALTRYAVNAQTGLNYFADNSNVYYVSANDANDWGNFPGQTLSYISETLISFANYKGEITPYVSESGNSNFYVMDSGVLHAVTSPTLYNLWAGQNNPPFQLSSAYFNTLTISSALIDTPEFTGGGATYVLSDREIFSLNSNTANLVPSSWGGLSISFALANTFINGGPLHYMVQVPGSPTVYLLDTGGAMRAIPDLETDSAFQVDSSGDTSQVSNDLVSLLPAGNNISSNIVTIAGQSYVMNGGLQPIPSSLSTAYNASSTGITLNNAYVNIFPVSSTDATAIVRSPDAPGIYFLNAGNLMPFSNPTTFSLVAGSTPVTSLTDAALTNFGPGAIMQNYVTNGTTNYLIDTGTAWTVPSAGVASAWNLSQPVTLSTTAISNFTSGGTISQAVQIPNGQMCLIDGQAYCAGQAPLVTMWRLNLLATFKPSQLLLSSLGLNNVPLSPFVGAQAGQANSGTLYTMAGGQLINIPSMNDALNLGINRWPVIQLDAYTINSLLSSQPLQGYLAEDSSGGLWILDGGNKHALPSQYQAAWVGSNTPTVLGSDYLALLPTAPPITNSISSSSSPTIYGMVNGKSYAFTSLQSFNSSGLAGSTSVYNSLIQSIPSGGIWTP
ncbi:MAG TPA: hypothetical protein VMR28_02640 [Candidatus Saccharimonadales bacterium]|nr:hypothetical protein [Candidatus Saccharimonadales bacterium]